jgi:hypothetical protein
MTEQIVNVVFTIQGRVQLDLARAEEDPWWESYNRGLDLNDPVQLQQAMQNYVSAYLRAEHMLDDTPWACGPASIYSVQIEVKEDGRSTSNNASVSANV